MKVVNYTELRLNLKKWLDIVINDVEEVIIKRKDNQDLVLISMDEYRSLKETKYLLSGNNKTHIEASLAEAKAGKFIEGPLSEE